ncbi:DNA polymerase thumb domain-containing protein [Streptomyces sp. HMX112]|uniref:DNA polymerase Y family protein n=1 Tax=Streptomyces sp. HMX112 TaxID=3390850 RepID=UPI003A807CAA
MILQIRFRLEPAAGAGGVETLLPGLIGMLGEFTPVVEASPPDAALADVGGALRYFGRGPAELAAVIRVRALALYGVDCAIGAGPNPMLARMAARAAVPGTTLVVTEPGGFLRDQPVAALDGVGPATARTLCSYGLDSVGRLAAAPLGVLQRIVGARAGRELWERARGVDRTAVVPNAASRSVAAERAFPRDELDQDRHRRALLSLTEELGARMRDEGQVCRSLALTVRYADRSATTRSRTLREPTAHSAALTATAYALHEALGLQRARVRGIGLRAEGLLPAERAARQLALDPADEKARRLEAVADRARARFGPGAIVPGSLAA